MANRKPMDLRKVLVYYNAVQTIFSAWIFYEVERSSNCLNNKTDSDLIWIYILFVIVLNERLVG